MIRLAANVSTLFTEMPFLERLDAAAKAGFSAVECQFPYAVEPAALARRLQQLQLPMVLMNGPLGRAEAGERGTASLPGREADFQSGIDLAIQYLDATGCRQVHVMAGLLPATADRDRHLAQFVHNIAWAADRLAALNVTVLIEPINTRDVPAYLLDATALAADCIARAGRGNIRLQFDVYHMQIMQGDLIRSIEKLLPSIGHIQIADNPGRHEPGSGEINFERVLSAIDAMGYTGWIGCEYTPKSGTLAGLGWAAKYLRKGQL
jgi:hydroxypyruvate isomerase